MDRAQDLPLTEGFTEFAQLFVVMSLGYDGADQLQPFSREAQSMLKAGLLRKAFECFLEDLDFLFEVRFSLHAPVYFRNVARALEPALFFDVELQGWKSA